MSRFVCIHGHFYQPPRENPWLDEIELQESALPYHDWNERICAECYEPNTAARILDDDGIIRRIVSNYARMSFNFGPTLLAWMEDHAVSVYRAIVEADALSVERFSGHGSAMAQVYNHMILPLANERDKRTQVRWGIADFTHRFGRQPEGMWLAETAVDVPSLEALAAEGIRFTVLSPNQARRTRRLAEGDGVWRDAAEGLDTTQPYRVDLPSGRQIAVFFYDGGLSQGIAFERLLSSGEEFRRRLIEALPQSPTDPNGHSLVHVATDGETYGHHHRYGDMALAYVLDAMDRDPDLELTNYGEYLERYPPTSTAQIVESSSWSCAHGVERWRSDCGCKTGGPFEWDQKWRSPLRESLDWLRDDLSGRFESTAGELFSDPWEARDDYVRVILDPTERARLEFLATHAARPLGPDDEQRALGLLELQRHAMLMFTSCGWFFDDVSRIETLQIIKYAGRAVDLSRWLLGHDPESELVARLSEAKSNVEEKRDAGYLYESEVRPAVVSLRDAAAHHVLCRLFDEHDRVRSSAFDYQQLDSRSLSTGRARLIAGTLRVVGTATRSSELMIYCALRFGGHNVQVGVRGIALESEDRLEEELEKLFRSVEGPFNKADFAGVLRLVDRHFDQSVYSLKSLFQDQRQVILNKILQAATRDVEAAYGRIHEQHAPTMAFLKELGVSAPDAFTMAARVSLNRSLRDVMQRGGPSIDAVSSWLDAAASQAVPLDSSGLAYRWSRDMESIATDFFAQPEDEDRLRSLERCLAIVERAPFEVDLWKIQNGLYRLMRRLLPEMRRRADSGDSRATLWLERVALVASRLSLRWPEPEP